MGITTTKDIDIVLAKLCKNGAVMDIYLLQPKLVYSLGWAKMVDSNSVAWVPMWPTAMQDGHLLTFDKAAVLYDRDVIWYDDAGNIIAQAVPWQEASSLPPGYLDQLRTWQAFLVESDAIQRIYSWINNNLGTSLGE